VVADRAPRPPSHHRLHLGRTLTEIDELRQGIGLRGYARKTRSTPSRRSVQPVRGDERPDPAPGGNHDLPRLDRPTAAQPKAATEPALPMRPALAGGGTAAAGPAGELSAADGVRSAKTADGGGRRRPFPGRFPRAAPPEDLSAAPAAPRTGPSDRATRRGRPNGRNDAAVWIRQEVQEVPRRRGGSIGPGRRSPVRRAPADGARSKPRSGAVDQERGRPVTAARLTWGARIRPALVALAFASHLRAHRLHHIPNLAGGAGDGRRHVDAIVVMGAAQYNGRPSGALAPVSTMPSSSTRKRRTLPDHDRGTCRATDTRRDGRRYAIARACPRRQS